MLADPQTITIAATPNTLPRVGTGVNLSTYRKEDSNLQLEISHTYGKTRNRRAATIIQRKIAADPLISAQNIEYNSSSTWSSTSPLRVTLSPNGRTRLLGSSPGLPLLPMLI